MCAFFNAKAVVIAASPQAGRLFVRFDGGMIGRVGRKGWEREVISGLPLASAQLSDELKIYDDCKSKARAF